MYSLIILKKISVDFLPFGGVITRTTLNKAHGPISPKMSEFTETQILIFKKCNEK